MRRTYLKGLAAVGLASALVLSGCGSNDDNSSASSGKKCDLKLGFFGALTGDAANLGKNIRAGADLAINQYNEQNADCKVNLVDFDSQGSPDQAPGLAKKAIDDKSLVGIIGPAFSGESEAADPLFEEAGLSTITASATDPALADNGYKYFHRILGNDNSQGPAAAKYIKDTLKAQKVFVIDDASAYGKGLADIVKGDLGDQVVGTDTIQVKQTDFSATVTKVKSSGADAVFFGGYYAEAGLIVKQLRDAGSKATMVVGDGVKDEGFIQAAGKSAAEGTVITCPCLPPDQAKAFYDDYKAANGADPGTYGAEAYDAANVFLAGIKDGKTDRAALNDFVTAFTGQGATKNVAFDDKGEVSEVIIWAYTVKGGKIVPDQEVK